LQSQKTIQILQIRTAGVEQQAVQILGENVQADMQM
jgi:hypothetical protein